MGSLGFFQVLSTHLGTEMQYCAEEGPRAPAATRRQRCLPASGQLAVRKGRSGHTGKWQAQEPARKEEEEEKAAAIRTLLSEATEEQKQRLCRRGHSRPASRRWDWSPNRGALRSNQWVSRGRSRGGLSGGLRGNLWPYGLGLALRRACRFQCNHARTCARTVLNAENTENG